MGVVKTWNGIARASLKTWDGIAAASVKTINGFDATASGGTETVGYTTEGGSFSGGSGYLTDYVYGLTAFTAGHTGNITSIFLYGTGLSATADLKLGLYTNSSGNPSALVSGSPVTFTNPGTWSLSWKEFSGLSLPVTNGTTYWFGLATSETSAFTYYYDATSEDFKYQSSSYASAWPDPYSLSGALTRKVSIKATLTY